MKIFVTLLFGFVVVCNAQQTWWADAIHPQGQIGILTLPSGGLSNMLEGASGGLSPYGMNRYGVPAQYVGKNLYFRRGVTDVPNQCPTGYKPDENGNCRPKF